MNRWINMNKTFVVHSVFDTNTSSLPRILPLWYGFWKCLRRYKNLPRHTVLRAGGLAIVPVGKNGLT